MSFYNQIPKFLNWWNIVGNPLSREVRMPPIGKYLADTTAQFYLMVSIMSEVTYIQICLLLGYYKW